jgi:tryptophanyl-tRNA synthetase
MQVSLNGIQPSGTPHLGNYLGMIRPALALAQRTQAFCFVADYHALTTTRDAELLRRQRREVAASWLALGLDSERSVLYQQSDVPEVCELAWILACVTPKGLLNRAHAYKSAVGENVTNGRDEDAGVSMGLFEYPLLMAADILIQRAHIVPVGLDQRQHVEITRDIAQAFNAQYGEVFVVPAASIDGGVKTVAGTDGRKMSKSSGNVIPILSPLDELRRRVLSIMTDSRAPWERKDPATCNVCNLYRHIASAGDAEAMAERYRAGVIGYREAKDMLFDALEHEFREPRERFGELMSHPEEIDAVLDRGAARARAHARPTLEAARAAVGLDATRPRPPSRARD